MFGFFARTGVAALAAFGACLAHGQSFNIDVNQEFAPPSNGGGVPSDSFGAAANQPGRWNRCQASSPGPWLLYDLNGNQPGVVLTGQTGGAHGFNNPLLTGDYALLMKDGRNDPGTWTFGNLIPGRYRLYTYAVLPTQEFLINRITVPGSITANPQVVTGPLLPMQFALGITHSIHDVDVTSVGQLVVNVSGIPGGGVPYINGFQLILVPEPGTMLGLSTLTLLLLGRRRRGPTSSGSKGI